MRAGLSLTDEDRHRWLRDIRSLIDRYDRSDKSAIVACSALRQAYRDILTRGARDAGYRRLHTSLRREGWQANHKRFYRLSMEEVLVLRRKKPRQRRSVVARCPIFIRAATL